MKDDHIPIGALVPKGNLLLDNAPFNKEQRIWLSGYLAGFNTKMVEIEKKQLGVEADSKQLKPIDILYGTQTGNAEQVAQEASALAISHGFEPRVLELDSVTMDQLQNMKTVIIIVATYGEGEMPDNADLFWGALSSSSAPRLSNMRYGVLALGDTSYEHFCQAGKFIDTRLEQLGADRIIARIDCDYDFEDPSSEWLSKTLPLAKGEDSKVFGSEIVAKEQKSSKPIWNRKNPYGANVIENRILSGVGSRKEIRHLSFDLGESGITYEVGDTVNVMPTNHIDLVTAIIRRFDAAPDDRIQGQNYPLGQLLSTHKEIMNPSKELVNELANKSKNNELTKIYTSGDKEALEAFLWGKDTLDLLNLSDEPPIDLMKFISCLKPLQHRAYSISSSSKAHPNEIHVTVAAVRWEVNNREHRGVASTWLADCQKNQSKIPLFVSPNKNFRIPEDDECPVIMVGPGTGVAPFRAFLEERKARGSCGRNWLFFGDQHSDCDFIYQEELSEMMQQEVLTRLDLAFSRDQKEKIYVQQRMLENSAELYSWLQDGASFYVCGDASKMAKDVDSALIEVVRLEGNFSSDGAIEYVNDLKLAKRYLRDVY